MGQGSYGGDGVAPILEVTALEAGYTRLPILSGIFLRCEQGQVTTIIGPNGCGKSTLLKAIVGLLRPRQGSVRFAGKDVTGWAPERLLTIGMAMLPQARSVFPNMTVAENLRLGGYVLRDQRTLRQRLDEVLSSFPRLADRRRQLAGTLSGGEQRMLELGRALILHPKLLLMDEPSAMLSPALLEALFTEIARMPERGTTILLVEQNIRKAFEITQRVYVLDYGTNYIDGTPAECLRDPRLAALYLGGAEPVTGTSQ